ncbi:CoA transferase [Acidovorax sp. SUPP2539]|uniref:CaiB/BaiF CoA transferase family protein n=1 Tax=Acidovorax sp. SUPP2539 TaxID=2920878 RepID=UPI0023DE2974|nr:CoA transferase [Acidovorax sp. SUPP2539]GKS89781.1 CoA transferase [Acidovorax sp. SUPP2539]
MTDNTHSTSRTGPLAGVRILDLTSVIMGPFATQILAQLGAEVIKVETPDGDNMRHVGPMRHPGMGHIFLHANAGKRSIALDLKHPEGREAALRLAERCDVLISNVRPQALARLGLDPASVAACNPRLIHVSCCGFDQEGPDAARPAYDDLIQGATGIPWLMQRYGAPEPAYAPTTLSDRVTGLHAVYAVTAALYAREKTGQGQAIVVPMFEAMAQFILGDHMAGLTFEPPQGEAGYARLLTTHRKPYATADGMLCVLIYNDKHWRSFFAAIGEIGEAQGLAQDPRFATHGARAANIDAVYAEVARILRTRTTAQWQALLDAADVPHMPMNSPADLLTNPQLRATGFLHDSVHPTEGPMHAMAHPTRWSATPPPRTLSPAPQLGEHTRALLAEAGYTPTQIDALLTQNACHAATGEPA